MAKWYKKMFWWQIAIFFITPVAGIGEGAIILTDAHWAWHILVGLASGALAALKFYGKDENKNGIVDELE